MAGTRAAIRYAKALLSLALDNEKAGDVNRDMLHIADTLKSNLDLQNVVLSPVVNTLDKKAILEQVFKNADGITSQLFNVLQINNRIQILGLIAGAYSNLYNAHMGVEKVTVTTAVALTPELEAKVLKKVKELTPKQVVIENIIDESVIGGFVLRVGDVEYNASLSNQLNKLKRQLILN
jgi:F-type H+-transporting ATPase subunit delta